MGNNVTKKKTGTSKVVMEEILANYYTPRQRKNESRKLKEKNRPGVSNQEKDCKGTTSSISTGERPKVKLFDKGSVIKSRNEKIKKFLQDEQLLAEAVKAILTGVSSDSDYNLKKNASSPAMAYRNDSKSAIERIKDNNNLQARMTDQTHNGDFVQQQEKLNDLRKEEDVQNANIFGGPQNFAVYMARTSKGSDYGSGYGSYVTGSAEAGGGTPSESSAGPFIRSDTHKGEDTSPKRSGSESPLYSYESYYGYETESGSRSPLRSRRSRRSTRSTRMSSIVREHDHPPPPSSTITITIGTGQTDTHEDHHHHDDHLDHHHDNNHDHNRHSDDHNHHHDDHHRHSNDHHHDDHHRHSHDQHHDDHHRHSNDHHQRHSNERHDLGHHAHGHPEDHHPRHYSDDRYYFHHHGSVAPDHHSHHPPASSHRHSNEHHHQGHHTSVDGHGHPYNHSHDHRHYGSSESHHSHGIISIRHEPGPGPHDHYHEEYDRHGHGPDHPNQHHHIHPAGIFCEDCVPEEVLVDESIQCPPCPPGYYRPGHTGQPASALNQTPMPMQTALPTYQSPRTSPTYQSPRTSPAYQSPRTSPAHQHQYQPPMPAAAMAKTYQTIGVGPTTSTPFQCPPCPPQSEGWMQMQQLDPNYRTVGVGTNEEQRVSFRENGPQYFGGYSAPPGPAPVQLGPMQMPPGQMTPFAPAAYCFPIGYFQQCHALASRRCQENQSRFFARNRLYPQYFRTSRKQPAMKPQGNIDVSVIPSAGGGGRVIVEDVPSESSNAKLSENDELGDHIDDEDENSNSRSGEN